MGAGRWECAGATLLALLALTACNAPGARRSAPSAGPRARDGSVEESLHARFVAPGKDGWGQAGNLRYLERILAGADPAQPLPLVIMIHGLGDAPRFDWFAAADAVRTPMRLIMPQAPTPYYDGFAWFPFDRADLSGSRLARGIREASEELARSIALLRARRPTLGRPIVTGFSQGGMLSYALALRHPELVELSHPISGLLPDPLWPTSKPAGTRFPRIAAMHGDRDDLVPIAPARALSARLSKLGYEVSLREFSGVRHQITPDMEAYTVQLLEGAARDILAAGGR